MVIPTPIKEILEAAILAPSGDNCQPWRFRVAEGRIELYNLPGTDTSLFNFRQRAALVAHGALIENLAIAASARGYLARTTPFPDRARPDLVAIVDLEPAAAAADPLYPFLGARSTNRRRYSGGDLNDTERSALVAAPGDLGQLRLLEHGAKKEAVERIVGLNDRLVFENRHLHAFLFEKIRWSDEEARRAGDGLDLKTLELAPPDAIAFRLFKNWSLLQVLNRFGVSRIVGKNAQKLARSACALGVVTVPGTSGDDGAFLTGGRALERVWLEATRLGLSFQPMTGIVFLMHRVLAGATQEFSPLHAGLIRQACQELASSFGTQGETPVMLFRVGRSAPPHARSLRLPVERLLM